MTSFAIMTIRDNLGTGIRKQFSYPLDWLDSVQFGTASASHANDTEHWCNFLYVLSSFLQKNNV